MPRNTKPNSNPNKLPALTPLEEEFLRSAELKRTVRIDGKTVDLSQEAIAVSTLYKNALNGSVHGMGQYLHYTKLAQEKREAQRQEEVELGYRWKSTQQKLLNQTIKRGESTRMILPHPDDIIIDPGTGFRTIGPFNEESLLKMERDIKERDVLMLQAALEDRMDWDEEPDCDPDIPDSLGCGSARLTAHMIDQTLPQRHRLTDADWMTFDWKIRRKTKRELLKDVRQAWRSIGVDRPRGARTLPIGMTLKLIAAAKPHLRDLVEASAENDQSGQSHSSDKLFEAFLDVSPGQRDTTEHPSGT